MDGAKGSVIDEVDALVAAHGGSVISLAGGTPARTDFPAADLREIAADVLGKNGSALAYGHALGEPQLLDRVLELMEDEEVRSERARLIVTAGGMQGLDLVFRTLIDPGDLVIVESASYGDALSSLATYGPELATLPLDEGGAAVEDLPALIERVGRTPELVYVIPTFQNPTGLTMTLARRLELLELAERYGFVIVEDDPYSRFRFRGDAVPSLASLDGDGRVIAVRTFSKTIAPGLRVGWVSAPEGVVRAMVAAKQANDPGTGVLNQRLVAEFLGRGLLEPHVERLRLALGERRDAMVAALDSAFANQISMSDPEGGIFIWVTLPAEVSSEELLPVALRHGVAFVPGSAFSPVPAFPNTLRICFGGVAVSAIEEAVGRFRAAYDELPTR
jgi:2-aminoadipate transaminase